MRTTEQESLYQNLENQTVFDLLTQMNQEDFKVPKAVSSSIPQIKWFSSSAKMFKRLSSMYKAQL